MATRVGNRNAVPYKMGAFGLPGEILSSLVYWLGTIVEDSEYPNKIGNQDRAAAGGEVFPGRALAFDGVDQQANYADNGALDVNQASTDFVLSGWTKASASGAFEYHFGKLINDATSGQFGFFKDNANIMRFGYSTSTGSTFILTTIDGDSDTDWHLFTARIDLSGSRIYVYVDGTLQNAGGTAFTGAFDTLVNSYKFYMGCRNDNSPIGDPVNYADTQARDVRIYHKDITSAANLASLQKGEALGDEIAWWFCEGTDTLEVFDASGNGYYMTAQNFDSTSFVEGNWQSLMNKYGYAIDVDGVEMLSGNNLSEFVTNGTATIDSDNQFTVAAQFDSVISENIVSNSLIGRTYHILADGVSGSSDLRISNGTASQFYIDSLSGAFSVDLSIGATAATTIMRLRDYGTGQPNVFTISSVSAKPTYDTAIPPDMSTLSNGVPTHDIFGNALTFAGQAQYKAVARDRSCFLGDGVAYWDTGDIQLTSTFEIEIRTQLNGTADSHFIGSDNAWKLLLRYAPATNEFFIYSANGYATAAYTQTAGNWITIVYGHIAGTVLPYITIDGVSLTVVNTSIGANDLFLLRNIGVNGVGAAPIPESSISSVTINNGPNWQFVEGQGNTVHDVSGSGNHLTGVNVANNNWGVVDLPTEDYLAEYGGNFVGKSDGTDNKITWSTPLVDGLSVWTVAFRFKNYNSWNDSTNFTCGSTGSASLLLRSGSWVSYRSNGGTISNWNGAGDTIDVQSVPLYNDYHSIVWRSDGTTVTLIVDGVDKGYLTPGDTILTFSKFMLGYVNDTLGTDGDFWDLRVWHSDVGQADALNYHSNAMTTTPTSRFNVTGLFNTEEDLVGSNDGTWVTSGIRTSIIPALSDKTADALGQPLVYRQGGRNLIPQTYLSMPEDVYELYAADQEERYEGGLMDAGKGTFDDGTVESWDVAGSNTIGNDNNALKITYVNSAAGATQTFKETKDINTDLVVGDAYRLICVAKTNQTNVKLRVIGSISIYSEELTTEYSTHIMDFIAGTTTTDSLRLFNFGAGDIVHIDRWELFHKTTQTGNNLIDNGGARNAIGALTTTDWDDGNSDGLADGWSTIQTDNLYSIVTGNGFSGNAQRFEIDTGGIAALRINLPAIAILTTVDIQFSFKYRTNRSDMLLSNGVSGAAFGPNTGDAILHTETLTPTTDDTSRAIRLLSQSVAPSSGDWMEIDEFEVRYIIDGEFYELEVLGGDPVIIQSDYFKENPYRYLTRYFNPTNWKDLMLLEAGHTLDYTDHLKLLRFTNND